MRISVFILPIMLCAGAGLSAQNAPPRPAPTQTAPGSQSSTPATPGDDLFEFGRALFEQFAPPEIKAEFEFPTKERWDEFAIRLQRALEGDSLPDLAVYLPEARFALTTLRTFPDYEEYADWLEQR